MKEKTVCERICVAKPGFVGWYVWYFVRFNVTIEINVSGDLKLAILLTHFKHGSLNCGEYQHDEEVVNPNEWSQVFPGSCG